MKYPILKSTLRVAGLLIAIIVLFSQLIQCKNNTEEELIPSLDIKETSISSLAGGSTQFLTVDAIHTDWQVEVPVADQKWCIASKVEGRLKVETTENSDLSLRSTTIVVRATADKNLSKTVELTQFGKEPVIITGFSKKEFSSESGQFDLTVSSNIDYTLTLDPADATWIRKIDMPQGKASGVTSKDYRFEYDSNNGGDYRTVFLLFKQIGGTVQAQVEIKQTRFAAATYNPKTPMMGWSSWNTFRIDINEDLIKATADAMVSKGLKGAGYNFINVDDGFFGGRDAQGNLKVHSTKFPNGMKIIADYIHSKGLRAGIYSEAGNNTCGSQYDGDQFGIGVGFYGHEEKDCDLYFKQWGYDFIKVDYCGAEKQGLDEQTQYMKILDAIKNTGRNDIRFNVCRWMFPGTWVTEVAGSWRISHDIRNNFDNTLGVRDVLEHNLYLSAYASPGHFNDMDMMQIGRNTMTVEEEKSHFGLWSIMCSPMLIGCDLRTIPQRTLDVITNREVIALNQDVLGLQAQVVSREGKRIILAKQIEVAQGKIRAVALFNGESSATTMRINFKDVELGGSVRVRDLWEQKNAGNYTDYYEVTVPAHGTAMLRLVGETSFDKTKFEGEDAFLNNYNAVKVGNNARVSAKNGASGGYLIGWLGNSASNWAEFRNVYSSAGGEYELTVYYFTGQSRNLSISVNEQEYPMSGLTAPNSNTLVSKSVNVTLKQGYNIIRLGNATGYAPDIDKIELKAL